MVMVTNPHVYYPAEVPLSGQVFWRDRAGGGAGFPEDLENPPALAVVDGLHAVDADDRLCRRACRGSRRYSTDGRSGRRSLRWFSPDARGVRRHAAMAMRRPASACVDCS